MTNERKDESKPERQKPAFSCRVGVVCAAAWPHLDAEGKEWFSVSFSRAYKDASGKWKSANSFGAGDLLALSEVAKWCWQWIQSQRPSYQGPVPSTAFPAAFAGCDEETSPEDSPVPF